MLLGNQLREKGNYEKALEYYVLAYKEKPDDPTIKKHIPDIELLIQKVNIEEQKKKSHQIEQMLRELVVKIESKQYKVIPNTSRISKFPSRRHQFLNYI